MSLHDIQTKVHVAKDKRNDFGGYNYRTAEGILAAIKAALGDGDTIVVSDTLQEVAGQIFVTSTATLTFADGATAAATGHAMHSLTKKGMDAAQITGSASSYARKYALAGLIAIDDGSVDPDGGQAEPVPFDAQSTRDKIKDAIANQATSGGLKALMDNHHTVEAMGKLPEPMVLELRKAEFDKAETLAENEGDSHD